MIYNCEIWGIDSALIRNIATFAPEKLQTKFCKRVLGVSKQTQNWACRAELGIFPLSYKVIKTIIQFYNHIIKSQNVVLKQAFQESMILAKHKIGWYYKFSCLLDKCNLKESNLTHTSVNSRLQLQFTSIFKQSLDDNPNNCNSRNKLRTYRRFKSEINL